MAVSPRGFCRNQAHAMRAMFVKQGITVNPTVGECSSEHSLVTTCPATFVDNASTILSLHVRHSRGQRVVVCQAAFGLETLSRVLVLSGRGELNAAFSSLGAISHWRVCQSSLCNLHVSVYHNFQGLIVSAQTTGPSHLPSIMPCSVVESLHRH